MSNMEGVTPPQAFFHKCPHTKVLDFSDHSLVKNTVHTERYLSEAKVEELIKAQWENAENRINMVASLLHGSKSKMTGDKISKALYALADEFGELAEKLSKPSSF